MTAKSATWTLDARQLRPAALAPPVSKSDAQRALALAYAHGDLALAGVTDDNDALPADVRVLRAALETLAGAGGDEVGVDCADGGAPFRIFVSQAAVATGARVAIRGSARLGERPHAPLLAALEATLGPAGLVLEPGSPWPLRVVGAGRAPEACFAVAAQESSQFPTGLLLAAATLVKREERPWTVNLVGEIASAGYLDLTVSWLRRMGFDVEATATSIKVASSVPLSAPAVLPGDWSSLGYLLLVAWRSGGTVARVDRSVDHPDCAILDVLEEAGLVVEDVGPQRVRVRGQPTGGVTASGRRCPDLLPTVAALACVLPAASTLTEVSILRHKESDRLQGIVDLVEAGGGRTALAGDTLRIEPGRVPARFSLSSRADHRLAMAAATLAVLGGSVLELEGPEHVKKSFPAFWAELARAGVKADGPGVGVTADAAGAPDRGR